MSKESLKTISEANGDLFIAPTSSSLAHCISRDCKLGAGIAKIFRQRFGRVEELKSMELEVGGVGPLLMGKRFIYNLVTKEHYWEKSTYDSLTLALISMKEHALKHDVEEISMPRIGCGLDRLKWEEVSVILDKVFKGVNIKITVYTM